jgi:hypothetical protein
MTRDTHLSIPHFYTVVALVVAIATATILAGCGAKRCTSDAERAWVIECTRAGMASTQVDGDGESVVSECHRTARWMFDNPCEVPPPQIVELDALGNPIPQEKP